MPVPADGDELAVPPGAPVDVEEVPDADVVVGEDIADDAPAGSKRRNRKEDATSIAHLLNHKPFNIWCHACLMGKMRDIKKFKGAFATSRHAAWFLQLVTCDHIVSLSMKALTGATNAFVLKDLMSGLTVFVPMHSKGLA